MSQQQERDGGPSRKERWNKFIKSSRFKLYCSYALSTAGDRMWNFTVALAMVKISDDLRLAAVSMAVNGLTVLTFAASLGRWIDRSSRFRAATTVLAANNISVACSAGVLVLLLLLGGMSEWQQDLLIGLSIVFGAFSLLASSGSSIIVKKDWVVEMARGDAARLSRMNATLVAIDQTSMIVAPILVGQLMTSVTLAAGCLFIGAWNILSFLLELYLLWLIYKKTPSLNAKKPKGPSTSISERIPERNQLMLAASDIAVAVEKSANAEVIVPHEAGGVCTQHEHPRSAEKPSNEGTLPQEEINILTPSSDEGNCRETQRKKRGCLGAVADIFMKNIVHSWIAYYRQAVFPAAFELALLYFTVLGFDGITTGFAYAQGLEENLLAVLRGCGALCGIIGTFVFPHLRKRVGLQRSGLISLSLQIVCLSLCVISVFLPGSPFDPVGYFSSDLSERANISSENTINSSSMNNQAYISKSVKPRFGLSGRYIPVTSGNVTGNLTSGAPKITDGVSAHSMCSIWTLLLGVVLARFGLWMVDLTITQIMQQGIAEHERGLINGVQSALQELMNMFKSILVIALPKPETFGILVIISFAAICSGFLSYAIYSRRIRGHLFHFSRLSCVFVQHEHQTIPNASLARTNKNDPQCSSNKLLQSDINTEPGFTEKL